MKVKGNISSIVILIILLISLISLITFSVSSRDRYNKKISALREQYILESTLDLAQSYIVNQLKEKAVAVIYNEGDVVSSTSLYTCNSDLDFSMICTSIENILYEDIGSVNEELSCSIEIKDNTSNELQVHLLDIDGGLYVADINSVGEITAINYSIVSSLSSITLEVDFSISGITYQVISYDGNEAADVKLSTDNVDIEISKFTYARS